MPSPEDRRYTESHEWFQVAGDVVTVGITQYAADELTDITYVEVKTIGASVEPGGSIGEVESVKTSSDVYSAVGGEIVEVNEAVTEDPSLLNRDPFEAGWLVKIRTTDLTPLDDLMDQASYDQANPVG